MSVAPSLLEILTEAQRVLRIGERPERLLDADGMGLRSCTWIWVRNNEPRGCIGCHEDGELTPDAPAPASDDRLIGLGIRCDEHDAAESAEPDPTPPRPARTRRNPAEQE